MNALRTPDDRFADLPDFPWQPEYVSDLPGFEGLRLATLDVGPADAEHTFLCLHGEPTWSFLYRKMIPVFLQAGGRVVAPDFFGFGRSDKPTDADWYTFDAHRDSIMRLVERLDLRNITLVVQDWGGLVGLTLPVDMPDRFARLLVMNTGLGVGRSPGPGFESWRDFVASQDDLDIVGLMKRATPGLSDAEAAAYGAPFPGPEYKVGARVFPAIVPVTPDMPGVEVSRRAAQWWNTEWSGPTFMAVGMQDPVLGPKVMKGLYQMIRGCPTPMEVPEGGHFVQEHGEGIARAALAAWS